MILRILLVAFLLSFFEKNTALVYASDVSGSPGPEIKSLDKMDATGAQRDELTRQKIRDLLFEALLNEYKSRPLEALAYYEQALQAAESCDLEDKDFITGRVCIRLANYYFQRNYFAEAASYYRKAAATKERMSEGEKIKFARSLYSSGAVDEGLAAFCDIYKSTDMEYKRVVESRRRGLAELYLKNGRTEDAEKLYDDSIASAGNRKVPDKDKSQEAIALRYEFGCALADAKLYTKAIAVLRQSLSDSVDQLSALAPQSCLIRNRLADILVKQKQASQAERLYSSLIDKSTEKSDLINALSQSARFHASHHRATAAVQELKKAILLCRSSKQTPEGILSFLQGNLARISGPKYASRLSDVRLQDENKKPPEPVDLDTRYFEFLSLKQTDAAKKLCESELLNPQPKNPHQIDLWYSRLGSILMNQGNYKEAAVVYEKQLEFKRHLSQPTASDLSTGTIELARAYAKLGEFEKVDRLYADPGNEVASGTTRAGQTLETRVQTYLNRILSPLVRKNDLAIVYCESGRLSQAKSLLQDIAREMKSNGFEISNYAIQVQLNLVCVCMQLKQFELAEELLKKLLANQLEADAPLPTREAQFSGFSYHGYDIFGSSAESDYQYKTGQGELRELPYIASLGRQKKVNTKFQAYKRICDQPSRFGAFSGSDWLDLRITAERLLFNCYENEAKPGQARERLAEVCAFAEHLLQETKKDTYVYGLQKLEELLSQLPQSSRSKQLQQELRARREQH